MIISGKADFTGETGIALRALIDSGAIRVLDLLVLTKEEDPRSTRPSCVTSTRVRSAG